MAQTRMEKTLYRWLCLSWLLEYIEGGAIMTDAQATIFQWSICGCILVWLVAVLVVTWQLHKDTPQPYRVEDEASRVAQAQWQKTEAQ